MIYCILAYAISWAFEIPLAASAQGWIAYPIPFAIHYLAALGPMLAAMIVTGIAEGKAGMQKLFSELLTWRVRIAWLLFAMGVPIGLFVIAIFVKWMTSGIWLNWSLLGQVDYLPYLGAGGALLLWLLSFGLGEETGWRAYALPRLQKRHTALNSTLILGVIWAFWHLPAFFYRDTYMAMGLVGGLPMLLLSILAASIVFTWLYNSTGGSLLIVILFHGFFDFLSVSSAGGVSAASVMSAAVMILAVLIVILYKPENLSSRARQVA